MSDSRRLLAADIFSLVVFSVVVNGAIELLSGLTFVQMIQSRVLSVPVNLCIARPYGLFRDWIMKLGNARGGCREILLDIAAYLIFQIPVYMVVLAVAGVSFSAIVVAAAGQAVGMIFSARPYGLWLQFCRARFVPGLSVA